jgi:hypothetical protein
MTDHSFIHETRYAWFITGLMYLNRFAVSKIHRRLISAGNSFPNLCEPSSCTGSESFQAVPKGGFFFFFFFFCTRAPQWLSHCARWLLKPVITT